MSVGGTTTRKGRSLDTLLILSEQVKAENGRKSHDSLHLVDVGPGGMVDFIAPYFPSTQNKHSWNALAKLNYGLFHLMESSLRGVGYPHLTTFEPFEIARCFSDVAPLLISIVDNHHQVLDAAIRDPRFPQHRNGRYPVTFDFYLRDISEQEIPVRGDVVIAYNTIERTADPQRALRHVADAVRPGGILSTTLLLDMHGFTQLAPHIYLRTA